MFCVSAKVLATFRHYCLGSFFFFGPRGFYKSEPEANWNFIKRIQLPQHRIWFKEHKGPITGLSASGPMGAQTLRSFVHSIIYSLNIHS